MYAQQREPSSNLTHTVLYLRTYCFAILTRFKALLFRRCLTLLFYVHGVRMPFQRNIVHVVCTCNTMLNARRKYHAVS